MPLPSLDDLKERKLVQWGLAYLAGAWLVLQVVALLGATYDWPTGLLRAVPVVLAVGFLGALVLAWYHGERGAQTVSGLELGILAALLGLAGLGVMVVAPPPVPSVDAEEADRTWLAVLPFDAIGGDDDHFAEGMTAELTETLGRISGLRVVAQTSASAFEDASVPTDSIGRALGVGFLVEGTVRPLGDSIRVTARLVEAATGATEWSETFARGVDDVFAVQQDIAFNVASRLDGQVGAGALRARGTDDPEAYRLILRSRYESGPGGDRDEALRLATEAIARDSTYAAAWSALCYAHHLRGNNAPPSSAARAEEYATARAACERALALDPDDYGAHLWLGYYAGTLDDDPETAEAHYQRAHALNPSSGFPLVQLASIRQAEYEFEEAARLVDRAVRLSPLSWSVHHYGAKVHAQARNPRRAVELQRTVLLRFPEHPEAASWMGLWLAEAGRTDEGIAQTRRALATAERDTARWGRDLPLIRENAAYVFALAGDRAEAERHLADVTRTPLYYRAAVEAALGDRDAAFDALERSLAAEEVSSAPDELLSDPWLDPLHTDPRWEALLTRFRVLPPDVTG